MPLSGEKKKRCLRLFSVTFSQIFVKLAGKRTRESSNESEIGQDRIIAGVQERRQNIYFDKKKATKKKQKKTAHIKRLHIMQWL